MARSDQQDLIDRILLETTPEFATPPSRDGGETGFGRDPGEPTMHTMEDAPGPLPGGPDYKSPYDIMQDATGPNLPTGDGTTPYDILAKALNDNPGPAQHPQSAEQMYFQGLHPDGGSFLHQGNGNMTVEQQAFQGAHPGGGSFNAQGQPSGGPAPPSEPTGLPGGPGGGNPFAHFNPHLGDTPEQTYGDGGGPGGQPAFNGDRVLRNADGSIRGVKDASGFYSGDNWSGYDNIINNAQRGDPYAVEKVKFLADQGDARAKTALGGVPMENIGGVPAFMLSDDYAKWAGAHNLEKQTNNTGNNPNHIGTYADVPTNPLPNDQVYRVQAEWVAQLKKDGFTGAHMDEYHNVIFDGSNGGPRVIEPGWKAAQELAAWKEKQNAGPPAANGNGVGYGGPRGNYGPPRGGGGPPGGGPPELLGAGGDPAADEVAAQRVARFFPGADPRTVPDSYRGPVSAVGYMPSVQPGGYSPYDEPQA